MMLRAAASGRSLLRFASSAASRNASTAEGSSVASLIKAVNGSSASSFGSGGLSNLKASIQPFFPSPAKDEGLSTNAQIALGLGAAYVLYKAGVHASSPDWVVDLSLDVIQSAWWISFLSFLPFRSIYVSLRGLAPHTSGSLTALRPAVLIKP
ncbi:hypothetical protein CEUSTIGMA_g631.t1 [Chlamydomonas eustigma]|uniref:Uncharacterized protein n=1 Tax=Chlamydomonas eustigma TaxID=1157962 RepID=A0A250WQS9_9CHLO|nr:hypothetical protein CEUSTIGMA_g631.t1 [Chlamydomonas eustigma]|eukprot:GAX73178.1 hypothetical protein CEUSTIGMA_g631.t1 [Chlamydomonas eustigma]